MNLNKIFFSKRPLPAILLILLAGLIVYANSFQVPFILDDYFFIEKNDVIRSLGNFFTNSTGYAFNPPRFVGILTFALNYHFGGLNAPAIMLSTCSFTWRQACLSTSCCV
jgi:hypothetical protein